MRPSESSQPEGCQTKAMTRRYRFRWPFTLKGLRNVDAYRAPTLRNEQPSSENNHSTTRAATYGWPSPRAAAIEGPGSPGTETPNEVMQPCSLTFIPLGVQRASLGTTRLSKDRKRLRR
ncbi:hypothetical protein NUW58_g1796 [Xylaria curta]|uniref:Uncharacterized protein n=1 Tax=Xylaria curta TaxID=42375 RepID=A0ACC1PL50_9PEZI|nr:hypothetical protein NUW58_g1796 [Xylaria curta]